MTRLGSVTIQSLGADGVVFADDSTGNEVVLAAEFIGDAASALQYFHDCNNMSYSDWPKRPPTGDMPIAYIRPGPEVPWPPEGQADQ
jgi:hypothetical protein